MKTMNYLKVVSTVLVLLLIGTSCSTSKKMALSCPKPVNTYKSKVASNHSRKNIKLFASSQSDNRYGYSFRKYTPRMSKVNRQSANPNSEPNSIRISTTLTQPENPTTLDRIEYEANLYASVDNSQFSIVIPSYLKITISI